MKRFNANPPAGRSTQTFDVRPRRPCPAVYVDANSRLLSRRECQVECLLLLTAGDGDGMCSRANVKGSCLVVHAERAAIDAVDGQLHVIVIPSRRPLQQAWRG